MTLKPAPEADPVERPDENNLADWERELLAQGDNAAAEAPETSEAPAKTESE